MNCLIIDKEIYFREENFFRRLAKYLISKFTSPESDDKRIMALFDRVVSDYENLIERICFGYANSVEELQDLKQDAMLNIWQSLTKFRGNSELKTWVYRVTLNSCVSTLRKYSRNPNAVKLNELYDKIDYDEERKQVLAELHECISLLNPLDKSIVMLWLDDISYEEIAEITGLSRTNVGVRINRAKNKLSNLMTL